MSTDHNQHDQHDAAVNKILAAMRDAAPPEGMEARIAQRLQHHAATPSAAQSRWRDAFANFARTNEWWRGAITGAAAVLLISAASLLAVHLLETYPDRATSARHTTTRESVATAAIPVANSQYGAPPSQNNSQPCAHPTLLRTANVVPPHATEFPRTEYRTESDAPSHPAPELPLTAQERALLRLAQTASPRQLAILNPEEYAHLEALSALKFEKAFAPPAPPPAPDDNEATTPVVSSETNSDDNPKPDSAVNPEAESVEKPPTN